MTKRKTNKCVICGEDFTEWPNNAMPIKEGKCCDDCNNTKVTPARLRMFEQHKQIGKN
jgi:hypothetical protein